MILSRQVNIKEMCNNLRDDSSEMTRIKKLWVCFLIIDNWNEIKIIFL